MNTQQHYTGTTQWALALSILLLSTGLMAQPSVEHLDDGRTVLRGADAYPPVTPNFIRVDLRTLPLARQWRPGDPITEIPRRHYGRPIETPQPINPRQSTIDPLLAIQAATQPLGGPSGIETPILNFDSAIGFTGVQPPDPSGSIGADHYIESINGGGGAQVAIYDKLDGSVAAGPFAMESLATAGPCASGLGDPIVFWDELAQRFVITEFTSGANFMCVYVQADPADLLTGGWFEYRFEAPSFPDYPKYGSWPDAYYVGSNEGAGSPVYAFERDAMIQGLPAAMQRFTAPDLTGFGFQVLVPAHLSGINPPPVGAPGLFMRHRDDEVHNPGSNNPASDFLEIWEFAVDWVTPGNSTFTGPTDVAITEIDSECNGLSSFNCFPQPSGQQLDPLREPIMWPLQYRNHGGFETLVSNLMTDVDGNDHGGVRWFELRQTGPGTGWALHQEGTFAPDDSDRWMGSASMDESGNITVGYSTVHQTGPAVPAGLRYAGRLSSDPAGTLPRGEFELVPGTGSQAGERWGDYSSMTVDPEDGCTFWYTNEYVDGGTWQTRVANFRFDSCGEATFILNGTNLDQAICAPGNLMDVELSVLGRQGYTELVDLSFDPLPTGFSGSITPPQVAAADPAALASASLSLDGTAVAGDSQVTIRGSGDDLAGGTTERTVVLNAAVSTSVPGTVALISPLNGAIDVSAPTFSWQMSAQASNYLFELATDAGFTNIIHSQTVTGTGYTPAVSLAAVTTYFWRVTAGNICGSAVTSPVFSFTTALEICSAAPFQVSDLGEIDILSVVSADQLASLNVSIQATHTWVGDLEMILRHVDTNTQVTLMNQPGVPASQFGCDGDDIDAIFTDAAANPVEDECGNSPAIGGNVMPDQPLAAFAGESLDGDWELTVNDYFSAEDSGSVDRWCLIPTIAQPPVMLDVTKDGTGTGVVSSQPAGIDCGASCSASFPMNSMVTLLPNPDVDSGFAAWSGDCTGSGACSVTMDQVRSVNATFTAVVDDAVFSNDFEGSPPPPPR